jgi:hypothetical protein
MPSTEVTPYALFQWDRRFLVPDFQRPYSWGPDEIRDLWNDLRPVVSGAENELFLGTIVLETSQAGRAVIWDGQQRLATIVMLLARARDYLLSVAAVADPAVAAEINSVLLGGALAPTRNPVISMGSSDDRTFREFVLTPAGDAAKRDLAFWRTVPVTRRRADWSPKVVDAFATTTSLLDEFVKSSSKAYASGAVAIKALVTTILHKIRLVKFETVSEEEAFRLFEVLNDRGLELSAADLIKNFLLSRVGANQKLRSEMKQQWDGLSRTVGPDRLTAFLRHFYMSRYGRTTRGDLYQRIVALCSGTAGFSVTPDQFLADVTDSGDLYSKILDVNPGVWTSTYLVDSLDTLNRLGATQWIPLLLAAGSLGLGEVEFARIARFAEVLFVRSVAVGGKNPNSLERLFSDAASAMWKSCRVTAPSALPSDALSQACGVIAKSTPDDAEFATAFNELTDLATPRVKLLLEKIERQLQSELKGGAIPNLPILDMEHICPVSDGSDWPAPGSQDYVLEGDRGRLGNLTLLHQTRNRQQKNAGFAKKQLFYASSSLEITKDLGSYRTWNLTSIAARQNKLAGIAARAWPLT